MTSSLTSSICLFYSEKLLICTDVLIFFVLAFSKSRQLKLHTLVMPVLNFVLLTSILRFEKCHLFLRSSSANFRCFIPDTIDERGISYSIPSGDIHTL